MEVITREEAERRIHEADPYEVVVLAFVAAIGRGDGGAILDLQTGEICARAEVCTPALAPCFPDRGEAYVVLYTVSTDTRETVWHESYEASVLAGEHQVLCEEEVQEVLERTRQRMRTEDHEERAIAGADAQSISKEEADEYLEEKNEACEDRLGHEFAY